MRSSQAADHRREVPRPVAVLGKEFASGAATGLHDHPRGQLLHAISGLMTARTERGTWMVPPGHALWIPGGVRHDVVMHGPVAMRTAYLGSGSAGPLPADCRVIEVSALLKASLLAFLEEAPLYDEGGRGGHLAALVVDEVARASAAPLSLPMPADPRLARLCRALVERPDAGLGLDGWAVTVGVSRRTLTRLFRAQTGLSFGAWRRRLRLLQAAARCAEGEPLARAAARVGYGSAATFRAMARRELAGRKTC